MKNNVKYPVVTEENFDEIVEKYLFRVGFDRFLRVPVPKTRKDFFDMTKNMYGVGLGIKGSFGQYEIEAVEGKYSKLPIPRMWDKKLGQYDGLKPFLNTVFNKLRCGGVAGSHYGQFNLKGHRHKLRLQKFWQSEFVPSEKIVQE